MVSGTTTVQGRGSVREAWTAARPALPPEEQNMWGVGEGGRAERRARR